MSYAGDVTVEECWSGLQNDSDSFIIDVRTRAEWAYVGMPDLSPGMHPIIAMEWQQFPHMNVDGDFARNLTEQLSQRGATANSKLYFLCRSGVRSLAAANAMASQGFTACYNIAGGFEGDADTQGHRGNINGWKAAGLSWRQN